MKDCSSVDLSILLYHHCCSDSFSGKRTLSLSPLLVEEILPLLASTMANKIKGIYKGFKYISQIFVVKEREMEIGYPTDVKHVAHIGWDGASGTAPSWMNEFKPPPDFSTSTLGNPRDSGSLTFSPWSSQDFDLQSMGHQSTSSGFGEIPPTDLPDIPKKQKRKKKASTSSLKSSSGSTRSSRASNSKASYHDLAGDTSF